MYQLAGKEKLFSWLANEQDPGRRQAMLDWLVSFSWSPRRDAQRVPGLQAPVYIVVVPLDPPVVIRFLLAEQFHAIRLISLRTLP